MSNVLDLPPLDFTPDDLSLYFTVLSPPFQWILRRGQGFVICEVGLTFKDGKERSLELTVGRFPTYPGFYADLRFNSDLWVGFGLVDGNPPYVGKVETHLPAIRKEV